MPNFYALLAGCFAVRLRRQLRAAEAGSSDGEENAACVSAWGLAVGFGVALALAAASKLNAVPVAMVLPLALLVVWLRLPETRRRPSQRHRLLQDILTDIRTHGSPCHNVDPAAK